MELYQLRSFVAVAQHGHMTRASEHLHLSQPAVTAHIKALEDELGVSLFERTHNGVSLTGPGKLLLPEAERILGAIGQLKHLSYGLKGKLAGRVRVGTIIDPDFIRLGVFLRTLVAEHPAIEIETHHGISGWVLEAISSGDLDGGFFLGPNPDSRITAYPLIEVVYRIVAPPLFERELDRADWQSIARMPWIWTPPRSSHHHLVSRMFAERNLTPEKRVVVADQEASMVSLVSAGMGLSLMRDEPAREAAAAGKLVIWKRSSVRTMLSFAYPAARHDDPVIQAVMTIVRSVWLHASEQMLMPSQAA